MMVASTVWTLALTLPFSPMTSLPPTVISPPISHSTWIESAMSNLPSMRARSPTTVSSWTAAGLPLPFSTVFELLNIGHSLRRETARVERVGAPGSIRGSTPNPRESTFVGGPFRWCNDPGWPRSLVPESRGGLEGADEALDPLVVRLERVLAEDGLALRVVELQVDPVDAVVLTLQVRLTDELAAQARAGGLRRHVLGLLDDVVVGDPVHVIAVGQAVVDALVGPDVVVLQVEQRHLGVPPGEAVAVHEVVDELPLDDPVELAAELHGIRLELREDVGPAGEDVLGGAVGVDRVHVARGVFEVLELHLERRDRAAVLQLDRLTQRRVVRNIADGLHR